MADHFPPDIGSRRARWSLRKGFLEIMEELCPEVREDLRDQVWEGSRARYQEIKKQRAGVAGTKAPPAVESDWLEAAPDDCSIWGWYDAALEAGNPDANRLDEAVKGWADRFNINSEWVLEAAIATIAAWESNPELETEHYWFLPGSGIWTPLTAQEREFTFSLPNAWDPSFTPRQEA